MTLAPLLAVSLGGSVLVLAASGRGGRREAVAGLGGMTAILAAIVLSFVLPGGVPHAPAWDVPTADTLFATGDYLRLTTTLWGIDGLLLVGLATVTAQAAGLPAAILVGVAAAAVSLSALDPAIAALAAMAGGLAGLTLAALAPGHATDRSVLAGAREIRAAILGGTVVVIAIHIAGALAPAALTPSAPTVGGSAAVVGLITMALVVGVAITAGVVPFHRRIPGLADAVPAAAAPILLAWSPLPLTVAALAALDRLVLPLALPLTSERAALIGLVLLAIAAAAIAAWLHEDLRHVVGYLVVAELGLGVLALAVLDPAAWAPARAWLLVLATSKTALGAWALATEARFGSRRLDDLRGWARRAPLLAAGLVVAVLATFGLPGWTAWTSRSELAELVAPGLPATVAWLVGWLTAPAYLRLLLGGLARPLTRVSDAPGERPTWTRAGGVPDRSSTGGRWETIDRLREWVAANRAPIASGLVLAAALLAGLTASGIAGAGDAAAQPAPTVAGGAFD